MTCFKHIYWFSLFFICIKGLDAAKIYVIDLPNTGDDLKLINNYDDYDPITESSYDEHNKTPEIIDSEDANVIGMCQRLFKNIFGHGNQQMRCLKALKSNKRSNDRAYYKLIKEINMLIHPNDYSQIVRQPYKYADLLNFSQDYVDVRDLGRTEFASDYVDVDDFKIARVLPDCKDVKINKFGELSRKCIPAARKTGLDIEDKGYFRGKEDSSDSSDESESDEIINEKKKRKRYKVVSKEVSDDSDHSDEDTSRDDDSYKIQTGNVAAESDSIENSDSSIEVTTKKPKFKVKKSDEINEKYAYLQGNKYFDANDYRRDMRMRMADFLPKRVHWDEDDYQHLSYFWFNGPKEKYRTRRT